MGRTTHTLLICTVGGTTAPLVATLKQWRPARICFVHTPQTKGCVEGELVPKARAEGVDVDVGRYDLFELSDGQDLEACLHELRRLTPDVMEWAARGDDCRVVVDFTGGTKCMSAAVALQARLWPCVFSYVGGGERTKGGVGVVVSGTEKVVYHANPWDALGYQAVDEFKVLFDRHAFQAAAGVAEVAKRGVSRPDRKRELAALEHLAKAFDAWDRFDHKESKSLFEEVTKSANDLRAVLGSAKGDNILECSRPLADHLAALLQAESPSHHHVVDLLANAKRRKEEGRFDDAVARLYRAIEAVAQVALKELHGIASTAKVPLERIPETKRAKFETRAGDGSVALGLQDSYALLSDLGDPLGEKFAELGLGGTGSPLVARNQSILAHGFVSVGKSTFDTLWKAALSLADVDEATLPSVPTLG